MRRSWRLLWASSLCLFLTAASVSPAIAGGGTAPVIESPPSGAEVSGDVSVQVTTNASYIAARWAGTGLARGAAAASGSASLGLPSYGFDGSSTIEVGECEGTPPVDPAELETFLNDCIDAAAVDEEASVTVTVANSPPTFTSPLAPDVFWDPNEPLSLSASAPGGVVRFDGYPGEDPVFDSASPYTAQFPAQPALGEGTSFNLTVTLCSPTWGASERQCEPTAGDTAAVTTKELTPSINAVSPTPFSPNGDGFKDQIVVSYLLDEAQSVRYRILDRLDTPVTGYKSLGSQSAGNHQFEWPPKGAADVSSGTYTVELSTTASFGEADLTGEDSRAFKIDVAKPRLTSPRASASTFNPVKDGYRDTVRLTVSVNEPLTAASVDIYSSSGKRVRRISLGSQTGSKISATWNGRSNSGALVDAGKYRFVFTGLDRQHLTGNSKSGSVSVSMKKLVTRSATVTKDGDQVASIWSVGPQSCTDFSFALSSFARGLWLANVCMIDFDGYTDIEARYSFSVPAAFKYTKIRLDTYGQASPFSPVFVGGGMRSRSDGWLYADAFKTTGSLAWRNLAYVGSAQADEFVSNRSVQGAVYLPGVFGSDGYDIGAMRLTVTYRVLV